MLCDFSGRLVLTEQIGELFTVRLRYGVFVVNYVEGGSSVVSIHNDFDRVSYIICCCAEVTRSDSTRIHSLRIGEHIRRGISVKDPHDFAVDNRRIRVSVKFQERGKGFCPVDHITLVQDAAI